MLTQLRFLCVLLGQSSVNFIFYLVDAREGPHGDFSLKDGRPLSGQTLISNVHTNSTLIHYIV